MAECSDWAIIVMIKQSDDGCLVTQNAEWNDRKAEIWNRRRNQLGGAIHQEKNNNKTQSSVVVRFFQSLLIVDD